MEIDHRFNTVKLLSSAVAVETAAEVVVRGQCPLIALLGINLQSRFKLAGTLER